MDVLNKDINIDVGHLLLLLVVIAIIYFVSNRCRLDCSSSSLENLNVPNANFNLCRCPNCAEACYQRALNGQLPGCSDAAPNYDQCNDSYRRCLLFGCSVASGNTCSCNGKA